MDRSTKKWRKMRFNKCKAVPKEAFFCDGCRTTGSKCPMRHKYRDDRSERTAEMRKIRRLHW